MDSLKPWISEKEIGGKKSGRSTLGRAVSLLLVSCLLGVPQAIAQSAQPAPPPQQTQQQNPNSTLVPDPSKGPLQPVPSQPQALPNAPSATGAPPQTSVTAPQQPAPPQQKPEAPLGAAAAEAGAPSGGLASKPAGNAIAPAKQRQVRSMLIKVGAIAAGAAALGIVYGLTRSTPSTPPGATTTAGH
jgi:hypothetical protein